MAPRRRSDRALALPGIPGGILVEPADVLVVDGTHSLELAGEGLRASLARARPQGKLLVLTFREDQLLRGTEGLGLGPPVATRIVGERGAAREAFLAAVEAVVAGREPPGAAAPLMAHPTEAGWRDQVRRRRRLAVLVGPLVALALWAWGHVRSPLERRCDGAAALVGPA